jgi:RNA polymerase sigma-70 factor, ECF subfamily
LGETLFSLFRSEVGDLDSLTQHNLYSAFSKLVFSNVLLIINDRSLTEDVIQEAFIKAMKNGPYISIDFNMTAWLKKIAKNTAIDMIRKNKNYRQVYPLESLIHYKENGLRSSSTTEEIADRLSQKENLIETLNELKFEFRVVLVLRYFNEMSTKELAKQLNITESALSKRLERARNKLLELFIQRNGE